LISIDQTSSDNLLDLATDGTRHGLGGVHVSEEARGVLLNLLDVEAEAVVLASGSVDNTGNETVLGAGDAADAAAGVLAVGDRHGVGEGDARGSGLALHSLVDVGGRDGRRLVLALEAGDGDVVADDVLLGVDAELVQAAGALEAAGEGVVGVDDLLGEGDHFVGGGENEGRGLGDWKMLVSLMDRCDGEIVWCSLTLLLVVTPALAPVLAEDGVGHGGGSHGGSDGGESELHVDGWLVVWWKSCLSD
jgi:hypothetical protein